MTRADLEKYAATVDLVLGVAMNLAGPVGAIVGSVRALIALAKSRPDAIATQEEADAILRDLVARNGATIDRLSALEARALAHEAYLRHRVASTSTRPDSHYDRDHFDD